MSIRIALVLVIATFRAFVFAGDEANIKRATSALGRSLRAGWSIVDQKESQIPWGHHWCNKYDGPKGTLLVIKGTRPVYSEFLGDDGKWRSVAVGTESLDVWVMPESYHDSYRSWLCFHRPIQPTEVVDTGPVRVYARPSSIVTSQKYFDELLSKSKGVRSPDSPWNAPDTLTWKKWSKELATTIEKEFPD